MFLTLYAGVHHAAREEVFLPFAAKQDERSPGKGSMSGRAMGQRRVALVRHVVASLALPVAALGALPVLRGPCAWSAAFLALFFLERLVHHRPVRDAPPECPLASPHRRRDLTFEPIIRMLHGGHAGLS